MRYSPQLEPSAGIRSKRLKSAIGRISLASRLAGTSPASADRPATGTDRLLTGLLKVVAAEGGSRVASSAALVVAVPPPETRMVLIVRVRLKSAAAIVA